ncbi:MAG: hypothetical protein JHC31_14490, partial [Sulfurihydrogenibium sp.]|nr:hypothetical protein [Sulfurihydrogenibium sp.]
STLNKKGLFNRFSKVREAINLQKDYLTLVIPSEVVKKLLTIIKFTIEKYGEEDALIMISKNKSNDIIVESLNERLETCELDYLEKLKNLFEKEEV